MNNITNTCAHAHTLTHTHAYTHLPGVVGAGVLVGRTHSELKSVERFLDTKIRICVLWILCNRVAMLIASQCHQIIKKYHV